MKKTLLFIALVSMLLVYGCSQSAKPQTVDTANTGATGNTASDAPVKVWKIDMYSFGIKSEAVDIKKGDKVRIELSDSSGTHGLGIPAFGISSGPLATGETKTIEFVADKAGTFDYFCNVPCGEGHRSMRGLFTVNE